VDVPVYQISANDKKYGGADAYYLIKSVKVQEQMRDLDGNMTRAKVDISLMQVPEFQVSNGRDLASKAAAGAKAPITSVNKTLEQFKPGRNQLTTRLRKVLKSVQITSGKNAGYFETTYERPDGTIQRKVTAKQQK
jgi:hypothetical protein